jgi:DnaJ-class molecular chaperone
VHLVKIANCDLIFVSEKMSKMRCHYEVLGVARDADQEELKKSYRKMALKVRHHKPSLSASDSGFCSVT